MGNQNSSHDANRKKEKKEIIIETKSRLDTSYGKIMSKETNSSYKGVKTCGDSNGSYLEKDRKEEQTTECQTITENLDVKDVKIPTAFEWKEGGNSVYITGTFSNWSQWFMMSKINNKFELNLVNLLYFALFFLQFFFPFCFWIPTFFNSKITNKIYTKPLFDNPKEVFFGFYIYLIFNFFHILNFFFTFSVFPQISFFLFLNFHYFFSLEVKFSLSDKKLFCIILFFI